MYTLLGKHALYLKCRFIPKDKIADKLGQFDSAGYCCMYFRVSFEISITNVDKHFFEGFKGF